MASKKESTHVLIEHELTLYQRERSKVWQCAFHIDGRWHRKSTGERDFKKARVSAHNILVEANVKKRLNVAPVTRRFGDIALAVQKKLEKALAEETGKPIYVDYIAMIKNYLIPVLGKFNVNNISKPQLELLDAHRLKRTGKEATRSTLLTQNAALNIIFTEAIENRFMTELDRPVLVAKGKASERRPAFTMDEIQAMMAAFDKWIPLGAKAGNLNNRKLLKYYVVTLLDTGARPGKELLNVKWKQVRHFASSDNVDERHVEIHVDGKTGKRTIIGWADTIKVLNALLKEQGVGMGLEEATESNLQGAVFRMKDGKSPTSFQKLFNNFLEDFNLLIDPQTEQKRVFYSLRHTYATFRLTYDKTPIHTLAEHMGTSVAMIEKHYSHLKVKEAMPQLRGSNTRRLVTATPRINPVYTGKTEEEKQQEIAEANRRGGIKSGVTRRAKAEGKSKSNSLKTR